MTFFHLGMLQESTSQSLPQSTHSVIMHTSLHCASQALLTYCQTEFTILTTEVFIISILQIRKTRHKTVVEFALTLTPRRICPEKEHCWEQVQCNGKNSNCRILNTPDAAFISSLLTAPFLRICGTQSQKVQTVGHTYISSLSIFPFPSSPNLSQLNKK